MILTRKIVMTIEDFVAIRTKRRLLHQIFWECTLRCNLNCLHCGSDCRKSGMPDDMPFKDFTRVLDEVAKEKNSNKIMIVTTGGEPLLRKDIAECGREITKKGFIWGMVSNGMLLTKEKLDELIEAGLKSIAISLDGFEDEHNWMRGNRQSFKNAVNAIKCLRDTSITWDVITCVNQRNLTSIDNFREFLMSIGVRRWRIFTIFPAGRAKNNHDLHLTPKQFRSLMEYIKQKRLENNIQLAYSCEGYLGSYELYVRNHPFFCGAGINSASIRYDGAISGCLSIRQNHDQGNIYKDSFMDVWNNRFQKYINREWMKIDECSNCNVWSLCHGGALHLRDENGKMASCSYLKLYETK